MKIIKQLSIFVGIVLSIYFLHKITGLDLKNSVSFSYFSFWLNMYTIVLNIIFTHMWINKIVKELFSTLSNIELFLTKRMNLNYLLDSLKSNIIFSYIMLLTYLVWSILLIFDLPYIKDYSNIYATSYSIGIFIVVIKSGISTYKSYKISEYYE